MTLDQLPNAVLAFSVYGRIRLVKQPEALRYDQQSRKRQPSTLTMRKILCGQIAQMSEAQSA
jgi:hypothetical protein